MRGPATEASTVALLGCEETIVVKKTLPCASSRQAGDGASPNYGFWMIYDSRLEPWCAMTTDSWGFTAAIWGGRRDHSAIYSVHVGFICPEAVILRPKHSTHRSVTCASTTVAGDSAISSPLRTLNHCLGVRVITFLANPICNVLMTIYQVYKPGIRPRQVKRPHTLLRLDTSGPVRGSIYTMDPFFAIRLLTPLGGSRGPPKTALSIRSVVRDSVSRVNRLASNAFKADACTRSFNAETRTEYC